MRKKNRKQGYKLGRTMTWEKANQSLNNQAQYSHREILLNTNFSAMWYRKKIKQSYIAFSYKVRSKCSFYF